jgi:CubicO group peptidase (beta-lactamase class C family)
MSRSLGLCLAVLIAATLDVATVRAEPRDRLTLRELFGQVGQGPTRNHYFLPMGDVSPAKHELSARLVIPETERFEFGLFPAVAVEVFTSNGHLIPVTRDILNDVRGVKLLNIIVSPGRVWSEPGDAGYSRASFPFTLTGLFSNRAHNGIASFLYDDTAVSSMVFQIVQETSVGRKFDAWGAIPISLERAEIEYSDRLAAEFANELDKRLPVRPMAALAQDFGSTGREVLAHWPKSENESVSGLVLDGTIYVTDCRTRHGPYPYCDEMRHGVQSATKTMGGLLAMLRLARKYGDQVFDLKIKDYLDVTAPHDGWNDVTFADALNMATGLGDAPLDYTGVSEDGFPPANVFRRELSAMGKLEAAFSSANYPWRRGEVFRYRSMDSFVLAAAMDAFLKSREGKQAHLWDMVVTEVLRPIGVYVAPMLHTREPDGSRGVPILGEGIFPTYHDLAKIALLLQNGGKYAGEQLLSAKKLKEALYKTEVRGKPAPENPRHRGVTYHMSLWHRAVELADCSANVPRMSGHGGTVVHLLPSGTAAFLVQDGGGVDPDRMVAAADLLRSECP